MMMNENFARFLDDQIEKRAEYRDAIVEQAQEEHEEVCDFHTPDAEIEVEGEPGRYRVFWSCAGCEQDVDFREQAADDEPY